MEDNTLEDDTLEDDTLEDDTLEDNTLEDNTLEDNTLEDNTLEDNTLEDNNLEDELRDEEFDEELQEVPDEGDMSVTHTSSTIHMPTDNSPDIQQTILDTTNAYQGPTHQFSLTSPLSLGARRGRKRGKGRGRPAYKTNINRYIPRGRPAFATATPTPQRGRTTGWRGRPPIRRFPQPITHQPQLGEQLTQKVEIDEFPPNSIYNPHSPLTSNPNPQNGQQYTPNIQNTPQLPKGNTKAPKAPKKIQNGDIVKFSGLWLIPGKPRKWRSVWKTVGHIKLRTWEAIENSSDSTFVNMQNFLASGGNIVGGFRKSSRTTTRAVTANS